MGFGGLESRAHCVGFSVMKIGNRKERMRDYASFPDVIPKRGMGWQPHRNPVVKNAASEQNAMHSAIEAGLC